LSTCREEKICVVLCKFGKWDWDEHASNDCHCGLPTIPFIYWRHTTKQMIQFHEKRQSLFLWEDVIAGPWQPLWMTFSVIHNSFCENTQYPFFTISKYLHQIILKPFMLRDFEPLKMDKLWIHIIAYISVVYYIWNRRVRQERGVWILCIKPSL